MKNIPILLDDVWQVCQFMGREERREKKPKRKKILFPDIVSRNQKNKSCKPRKIEIFFQKKFLENNL